MVSPQILNLTDKVWTEDDFRHFKLTVVDEKTSQIAFEKLNYSTDDIWMTSAMRGLKNKIQDDTKALDNLSLLEMRQVADATDSYEKKLKKLKNIRDNLLNHNKLIEGHNSQLFTSWLSCPTHSDALQKVNKQIDQLKANQASDANTQKQLESLMKSTQGLIDDGLPIDRDVIYELYPKLENLIQQLSDTKTKNDLLRKVNVMLNKAYLSNVIDQATNAPLPTSIWGLFAAAGLYKNLESEAPEKRLKLIENAEMWLKNPELNLINTPDLVAKVQQDLILIAVSDLPEMAEKGLIPILHKLYKYETELMSARKDAEKRAREDLLQRDVSQITDSDWKKILIQKTAAFTFPSPSLYSAFMLTSLKNIKQSKNEQELKEALTQLNAEIEEKKELVIRELEDASKLYDRLKAWFDQAKNKDEYWFKNNAKYKQFEFNQSQWGDQEIFGQGVCKAINYRWIKWIMKNPSAKIKSADVFNEPLSEHASTLYDKTKSKVSPTDRTIQATYRLEVRQNGRMAIGSTVLKKDKLSEKILVRDAKSIQDGFAQIKATHSQTLYAPFGGGVYDIGGYGENGGHAMGMQIDPTRGMYRFWDVNSGLYQYDSEDQMINAFTDYLFSFYDNQYNNFWVAQYSPKI